MTTTPVPFEDTFKDKLRNGRKAIGAGVTAGIAAATPLVVQAVQLDSDGAASITGSEVGIIVGGFFAALASVAYVTWQTVNKPTPTDIAALAAAVSAVPPTIINSVEPSRQVYDGLEPTLPRAAVDGLQEPYAEQDATPAPEGYTPRHTAE